MILGIRALSIGMRIWIVCRFEMAGDLLDEVFSQTRAQLGVSSGI